MNIFKDAYYAYRYPGHRFLGGYRNRFACWFENQLDELVMWHPVAHERFRWLIWRPSVRRVYKRIFYPEITWPTGLY